MRTRRRTARGVVALLVVLGASSFTPAAPREGVLLPTERCGDYYLVQMKVGDDADRLLSMLLDTGSDTTVVDIESLERVSGKRLRGGQHARFSLLTAGAVRFEKLRAKALELDHLQRVLGKPLDGILGYPAFGGLLLTFDYPAGEVRVAEGRLGKPDNEVVLRTVGERDRPWIELDFGTTIRRILIDTGSSSGLSIRDSAELEWAEPPRPLRGSLRIDHIEIKKAGRLSGEVAFGHERLQRPTAEVTDDTEIVGTRILRSFVVTFDPKRRRVRFERHDDAPIRFPSVRGEGMALRPRPAGFEVVRVFEGFPAHRTGIRAADLILAIDGTPVYEQDLCDRDDPDQDRVVLTVRRGDETFDVEVPVEIIVP